ncbi:regulator of G-protein signaling 12-like isoform X2 [Xyrauchen texanus]|uniref:regulator of G-protein signaling 12-like isoform X2 n=1 Tax=Xyrauchen texanus TaxID=154827 RepID=UPI00224291F1|nr:regulator of G-protein signaling 12-like isoform X2 [Xyrauchen texanus]
MVLGLTWTDTAVPHPVSSCTKMRVLKPAESAMRHLKRPPSPAVRRVEMERGRAGYGFTIAGQAPCALRGIIKGSPAYSVGLRPGDRILRVNGTDVSEATHKAVVKLIGMSSRSLCLLVTSGDRPPINSSSSDEELACQSKAKLPWLNPGKKDPFLGKFNGRDKAEPMLQSVGCFDTIFEITDKSSTSTPQERLKKQRPLSEPDMSYWVLHCRSKSHPDSLSQNDTSPVVSKDSVFSEVQSKNDFASDSNILNVAMIVGYINSMELELIISHSEEEALLAIRECISQIGIEQKTHSLVMMRIKSNCVQLCDDRDAVLVSYPAESLALCVICTEDSRFFGLVSADSTKSIEAGAQSDAPLKTLCHVFFIDPELHDHKEHQSIIGHFGIQCTPDPDTQRCLEFPQTPHSISNFVSVLYTDMGDYIEKLRLKLDSENPVEGQQITQNSGSGSDSGIGNASPEDRDNLIGQLSFTSPNIPSPPPYYSQHRNSALLKQGHRCLLSEPLTGTGQPVTLVCASAGEVSSAFTPLPLIAQSYLPSKHRSSQRRPSIGLKARWQKSRPNSIECLAERDDDGFRNKSDTLPPAMEQIPTLRYKPLDDLKHPQRMNITPQHKMACRFFSTASKQKDGENKGSIFWALTRGRASVRRPSVVPKRLSLAHSLNDLESATSDGEHSGVVHQDCGSVSSLESNGSLPCVTNHRRLSERRVSSWAVSFERLLQDPVGVRYFSEFLKKEFSEENILFWQACESFSQVPENDKKQLSQKAKEIYNCFLSSKATMPVNIDSQAQLADDVLTAPQPNMFKQPQLQIFNLMKMDSYARFLKSTLYQECMLADVEGRPLPDPCPIPCSPAPSKHSFTSDRSTFSTPKKEYRKPKMVKSSDDLREKQSEKKNGFFPWYRYPSIGKGQKKREAPDLQNNCNGRRESQGSLSSGASQELNTSCSGGKNECELRSSGLVWEKNKEQCSRTCTVMLPDGSSCCVPLQQGASIRQVLLELCQKQHINLAAVDLFLTGGEKPLVLDQESITLSCRDLRLEKRTLFRLDLVPINRSVGLKAKPTKPVTEVLRPVVAKYGLHLADLVARISGETEVLDLGVPISNLDGLRVVLERADPAKDKSKTVNFKMPAAKKALLEERDDSSAGKPLKGNGEDEQSRTAASERRKGKKNHKDEAEEFFELLSRAQSSRVDDQRGLLRKEDLVLPEFLRVNPDPEPQPPACSTSTSHKPSHTTTTLNAQPPKPSSSNGHPHAPSPELAPFTAPLSPILRSCGPQSQEEEGLGDLTLVGEGDITSPNSTLLPSPPTSPPPHEGSLPEAIYTPPQCVHTDPGTEGGNTCTSCINQQGDQCLSSVSQVDSAVLDKEASVGGITLEDSLEGYAAELRQCQNKMRNCIHPSTEAPRPLSGVLEVSESDTVQYKATFV